MKVEIWSDVVCPFCYIGKRRFEAALQQFPHRDEIEVHFKSFELAPDIPRDGNPGVYDMLAAKYGMSREQAIAQTNSIAEQAKAVGLDFRFDRSIQTNTFDAHRLAHYAAAQGKGPDMHERLFKAHFTDGLHVGDHETLAALAEEVGLDRIAALEVLQSGQFEGDVRQDEQEASMLGIRGVPFFVINRKYAVSGAQPTEVFAAALRKAWDEAHPQLTVLNGEAGAACTDEGCSVPGPDAGKGDS